MKSTFCLSILILLFFQSCCLKKGEEIDRVLYSVADKAIIPYADSQTVSMTTDEGFQFQLNAYTRSTMYSGQEHCEDYITYENYRANLISNLPNLDIELRLNRNYNVIDDIEFIDVQITVNRLYFQYDIEEPLETIDINGVTYTEVYRYFSNLSDDPISEVLFNKSIGILRINYLNGDYVQIN